MRTSNALLHTGCLLGALMLAACQPAPDKKTDAATGIAAQALGEASKGLGEASKELGQARAEIDAARSRLANENISLNRNENQALPNAEITPSGELVIEGKAVAATPEQKALLLAYRGALVGVIGDGMAIGMEGASIGIDAAATALKGVISGQSGDDISAQVGHTAKQKIKPLADQLCARMPGLYAAQQALAVGMPEFAPYAHMDQTDVDDCKDNADWNF